jgi:hypothetical protein
MNVVYMWDGERGMICAKTWFIYMDAGAGVVELGLELQIQQREKKLYL